MLVLINSMWVGEWVGVKWGIMYQIWTYRNAIVFAADKTKLKDILVVVQRKCYEWNSRRSKSRIKSFDEWLVDRNGR